MPLRTSKKNNDDRQYRVEEMRDSVEILAPLELVWDLLRPVEYASLLVPGVIHGFRVPSTPEGVGEIQCVLGVHAGKEIFSACEITEEVPLRKLASRSWGQTGPQERYELRLEPTEKGTFLERICTHHHRRFSLVSAGACRDQHRAVHQREFQRIQELLDGGWLPEPSA